MITFHPLSLNLCSVNLWFLVSQDSLFDFSISSNQRLLRVWVYIVIFYIACCVKVSFIENFSSHLSIVSIFGSIMVSLWSWSSSCIIDISWGVVNLSVSPLMSTMQLELSYPHFHIFSSRGAVSPSSSITTVVSYIFREMWYLKISLGNLILKY